MRCKMHTLSIFVASMPPVCVCVLSRQLVAVSVSLTKVQHVHVIVADGSIPATKHKDLPLLHHTRRMSRRKDNWSVIATSSDEMQVSFCKLRPSYPERGEGALPVTIGWYQMERCGSKMYSESLQLSGSGFGRGNTPPSTKSSPRNMLQLW